MTGSDPRGRDQEPVSREIGPAHLKEWARLAGLSPRRLKKILEKIPGSHRILYRSAYVIRVDRLPEGLRCRLDPPGRHG